jgi:hypothetical protein
VDLVSMLVGWNYQANLAWNPGAVLRQFMQPMQTVVPDMGLGSTMKAMKKSIGWYKSEELQKYYEARGVVTRDVMHERFREIDEAMRRLQPGGTLGAAKDLMDFLRTKGTTAFKKADDFNRIVAYEAQVEHAKKPAADFMAKKIGWVDFVERSKLDRLDAVDGPFTQVIKDYMTAGNVEGALHEMGFKFMRDTQFIYTRGNNPYVLQSTVGRFLGQYGTWPAQYGEYLRNMFIRGSRANRLKALGRWTAVNGALVAGASQVFGVEMGKWSFFSPMGYTGGPFLEMAQQASSASSLVMSGQVDVGKSMEKWNLAASKDADPVDRLQASRLRDNLYKQTVPLPWGQLRRTIESFEMMWNADYAEAAKRFMSLPSTRERPPYLDSK